MSRGRWLTPDVDGGDAVCRSLLIPPELMPFVGYLLDKLRVPDNWEQHGEMTIAETLDMVETMLQDYPQDCPQETATMNPILLTWKLASLSPVSGSELWGNSGNEENGGLWSISPASDGDQLYWDVYLTPGDYFMRFHSRKTTGLGKIQFKIGLTDVGSPVDFYSGTGAANFIHDTPNFTITDAGWYQPLLFVQGKNASSSGYGIRFNRLYIIRVMP